MLRKELVESAPPAYEFKEDELFEAKQIECNEALSQLGLFQHKTQVVFVLDISYSMDKEIKAGHIDKFVKSIASLASVFDDDQKLQIFSFGSTVNKEVYEINLHDQQDLINFSIEENIIKKIKPEEVEGIRSGTNYAPVLNEIVNRYYPESKDATHKKIRRESGKGVFVFFLTDGNCNDQDSSKKAIIRSSYCGGFFIKFIGIDISKKESEKGFVFLEGLDNMAVSECAGFFSSARTIDNVDFLKCKPGDIENLSFNALLREYVPFLTHSSQKNLLLDPGLTEDAQHASVAEEGRTMSRCAIL